MNGRTAKLLRKFKPKDPRQPIMVPHPAFPAHKIPTHPGRVWDKEKKFRWKRANWIQRTQLRKYMLRTIEAERKAA